jgi:PAS domain S-box-containing protein
MRAQSVRIYVLILSAFFAVALAMSLPDAEGTATMWLYFVVFTGLFVLGEFADVYFHDQSGGRWGITVSEAFLGSMIVALPVPLVALAIAIAVGVERIALRSAPIKTIFNIASYGSAALIAAELWHVMSDASNTFTVRNAAVLVAAGLVFAVLTHVFTSLVIVLAESGNFFEISKAVARTTVLSTVGAIFVGLFFTAAFLSARWTVFLFPPAFFALYLANRAILRQSLERQRVEHLHAASRALAAGPRLEDAVTGFLREVQQIVSSSSSSAFINLSAGPAWWCVEDEEVAAQMQDVTAGAGAETLGALAAIDETTILREDEPERHVAVRDALGARTAVVVPLTEGDVRVGTLAVVNRVGADEFDDSEARLLEALANELMISLSSYRLFEEITEERERFGRIFSGSKEGICLLDPDGRVKAWNPALERISGYSSADMMDRVWSELLLIRDREEDRLEGDELVGVDPDEELELVTRAGPSRWVSALSGPVGDAEDGGWVVLMRDVTAEHEVEAAKSDFLSTISHELRTPLTTIKGSLQVLARGRENLPAALSDQMIGVTTRGAERLERLVMNLLAVSQIESGTMPVFPDALPIEELVRDRAEALLSDHPNKTINGSEQRLVVRADRERLNHVIEHVLENAQKFGGKEGHITIGIARDHGFARLSVTDEGPGIAPEDHERIFERFTRLGDVLTRETQGAGVGLFIAARSVQAMGGKIWVESKLGEGATFHVTVPLAHPVAVVDDADTA